MLFVWEFSEGELQISTCRREFLQAEIKTVIYVRLTCFNKKQGKTSRETQKLVSCYHLFLQDFNFAIVLVFAMKKIHEI